MIYGADVLVAWGIGVPKPPQCAWPCWCGGPSGSRTLSSHGSTLIFVPVTRNLKDFVILKVPCQEFLSQESSSRAG